MKIVAITALVLAFLSPALADYNNVPRNVKAQIKAKCVSQYPDSYLLQSSCVNGELKGYTQMQQLDGGQLSEGSVGRAPASSSTYYANCSEARAAGAAPIRVGEPGYARRLDRDRDGIACE